MQVNVLRLASLLVQGMSMTYRRPIYLEQSNGVAGNNGQQTSMPPITLQLLASTQQPPSHIMAFLPDLSLPATVPELAAYHDQETSDEPFAIYALCDVDEDDITDITKLCDSACEVEEQAIRRRAIVFLQDDSEIL